MRQLKKFAIILGLVMGAAVAHGQPQFPYNVVTGSDPTGNACPAGAPQLTIYQVGNKLFMCGSGNTLIQIGGTATTTNALTMNNSGSGAASGTTFDGSVARTISYNTVGAAPSTGIPIASVGSAGLSATAPLSIAATGAISEATCAAGTLGACAPDNSTITAAAGVLSVATLNQNTTGSAGSLVAKAVIDLTAQAANVGTTTAYTTPAAIGTYMVSCYEVVTGVATSGPTLPFCNVLYTDADSNASAKDTSGSTSIRLAQNSAQNVAGSTNFSGSQNASNTLFIRVAASTNISYSTSGYAAGTGTPMQYAVHFRVYYMGP